MKKDISKRKTPFFCILKGLSNKQKKFSCHMHSKELLFPQGISARRDPVSMVCYVSKLDASFPSPGKMKLDMDQVSLVVQF